ncbi:relaxase/mobilization nuclease domain-containing protein [Synechocystis sp. PCC 7509]|uniref:relaxase/mobilization nuclease domain-containing protein n=1 Tax=Synechocystis sp. PCC 7509 TaxID=927677 RepID=UPI0002AC94EA|nr:relaxase/mobilization nuclease domain-containing protein [Synechocystis sp. PCC 7509]
MIGKISKSGSFKQLVEYLDKEDSVILGTNMYGQSIRELTAEFMTIRDLNPSIKQPVLHASLSLLPGESLSDEQFREVCETWMEKMGFDLTKNQYLIVRHKDTEHEHAHLAINRIDMLTTKVVIDSFERYRSQEIIRQLEQNYDLEQVAPSWQTFKNSEHEIEPNLQRASRKGLTHEIEIAAIDNPTMPEFFHRLVERQIRSEVGFTRNGKPKGITYKVADGEKVAGNALGKAYSFPGLQKYLKVTYDPTRDNQKLAEFVQSTQQQNQELQQEREPAREELEVQTPHSSLEAIEEQSIPEPKIQQIWSSQYGIPAIEDLVKAIPENLRETQAETPERDRRQREKAQAIYQQWDSLTRAIYQVEDPKDIDPRIAFLMQSQQQTSKQITQVLAQSPAVQELLKRDFTYAQSYSQFCQSQACDNQTTWQPDLDQYRRAVELERQQQEERRIASERQQQQQQERQHNLKLLLQWQETAIALGRPASYVERIREVTADYQRGLPLSEKTIAARQQDLAAKERQQKAQRPQGELSL